MSRPVKLYATQLEDRCTPAKFTIDVISLPAGEEGDTEAIHTGSLVKTTSVTFDAANKTEAVKAAFSGGITVTFGGQSTTYQFDSTAGSSGSAYRIEVGDEYTLISFEDLAGQAGCDWDYNDRTWTMTVQQTGPATVLSTDTYVWVAQGTNETAEVTVTVTKDKPGYEGLYHWQYRYENISFNPGSPSTDAGLGMFILRAPDPSGITNLENSMGWQGYVGWLLGEDEWVHWQADENGSRIMPGQSGIFSFTTPVCTIANSTGEMYDVSYAYGGGGQVKAPNILIQRVTWEENTTAAGAVFKRDMNSGPGGGDQVFPERKVYKDKNDGNKLKINPNNSDQIDLKVQLTTKAANKTVRIELYDVDDPSANKTPQEPKYGDPFGELDDETKTTDNHGTMPLYSFEATTDNDGAAKASLQISRQPGDNLRAVATVLPENEFNIRDSIKKRQDDGNDAGVYYTTNGQPDKAKKVPNAKDVTVQSTLLTVWRTLHLEIDLQKEPSAAQLQAILAAGQDDVDPTQLPNLTADREPPLHEVDAIYKRAYIQIRKDISNESSINNKGRKHGLAGADNRIPFERNLVYTQSATEKGLMPLNTGGDYYAKGYRNVEGESDLWVVWVITAYEAWTQSDNDHGGNQVVSGFSFFPSDDLQGCVYVFAESSRDIHAAMPAKDPQFNTKPKVSSSDVLSRTLAHEIFHRFGGVHDTKGIMGDKPNGEYSNDNNYYTPQGMFHMSMKELKVARSKASVS